MKKIYWMLFIILCAACNDPYDGDDVTQINEVSKINEEHVVE